MGKLSCFMIFTMNKIIRGCVRTGVMGAWHLQNLRTFLLAKLFHRWTCIKPRDGIRACGFRFLMQPLRFQFKKNGEILITIYSNFKDSDICLTSFKNQLGFSYEKKINLTTIVTEKKKKMILKVLFF